MVKRILFASVIILAFTGCQPKIFTKHDVVEKKEPVMYIPAPPHYEKPKLKIKELTPEERRNNGIISKAYADDMQVVAQYVDILETILNKYKELAASNPDMSKTSPEEKSKIQAIEDYFKKLGDANTKDQ